MAYTYYNRYKDIINDDNFTPIVNIKLNEKSSDKFVTYKANDSRLDIISQKFYGTPYFGWLILLANPQYSGLEFNIPNGSQIVVPFPLKESVEDYINKVQLYKKLYG